MNSARINPKTQTPNSNKIPNLKFQIDLPSRIFRVFVAWSFFGFWVLGFGISFGASLTAVDLRCEYLQSPLGLDEPHPRLTWRVESSERREKQTAYQIAVASGPSKLDSPDLWDSGKVSSSQTVNIVYSGKPLTSCQLC